MDLSRKKSNYSFWILQFLGWGFINCLSIFIMRKISTELIIYSIIFGILIGVFSTSILRWYLKRNISFEAFGIKELTKIVVSLLITCIIFGGLNFMFGYVYAKYGPGLTEEEIQMFKMYDGVFIHIINSLFIVGAWTITYLVIKLLLKLNRDRIERLELSTNLKQAQLNTLKGQINPHFMFNSLNNIRGLMLEDVEKSRDMLTKLSEILRYSLTKNNVNSISLQEELEIVDNYIDLSKIQFEDRLEFIKDIDQSVLQLQIPPMIIQLLVENATKHGISNLKDGGRIVLEAKQEDRLIKIKVKNTGRLRIQKNTTQLGLKNIKQRLKLLYADKASFSLQEIDGEVVADIKIPLE